jgi:hypothetical protein
VNEDQRAEWKRALAAKAIASRRQRYQPRKAQLVNVRGTGMVRLPAARKQPRATP